LLDHCNPLIGAGRNANGYQPTAVIVIPILTDDTFPTNGSSPVDLQQGPGGVRIFGMFLVDLSTVQTVNGVGPTCAPPGGGGQPQVAAESLLIGGVGAAKTPTPVTPSATPTATPTPKNGGGTGQCDITGQFLQNYNAAVLPSGTPTGTFVPGSITKVVQLVD
jgi:hypothetical protein